MSILARSGQQLELPSKICIDDTRTHSASPELCVLRFDTELQDADACDIAQWVLWTVASSVIKKFRTRDENPRNGIASGSVSFRSYRVPDCQLAPVGHAGASELFRYLVPVWVTGASKMLQSGGGLKRPLKQKNA